MKRITTETSEADSYKIQIEELKKELDRVHARQVGGSARKAMEGNSKPSGNDSTTEKAGGKASGTVKESGTNQEDAGENFLTTQSEANLKAADEKIKAAQKIKR